MRRIGTGLMVVGLVVLLAALVVREAASSEGRAAAFAEYAFYAGAVACGLGLALLAVRKLFNLR